MSWRSGWPERYWQCSSSLKTGNRKPPYRGEVRYEGSKECVLRNLGCDILVCSLFRYCGLSLLFVLGLVWAIALIAIATGTHFAALTLSEALLEPLSEALSKTLTLTLSIAGTAT